MSSETYVYARNEITKEISIELVSCLDDEYQTALCDVPNYETLIEAIDESSRLHIENGHLEECIEQAEARYDEELEEFWRLFAARVNTFGQDPLSLIADELKKYGLYFDSRVAA